MFAFLTTILVGIMGLWLANLLLVSYNKLNQKNAARCGASRQPPRPDGYAIEAKAVAAQ